MPVLSGASKLRFFALEGTETIMPADFQYKSAQDFVDKMDSGELDWNLIGEIKNLSKEQLDEVASVLMERDSQTSEPNDPPPASHL
jgi:hypothetical protein